jgi:hypothetical protein
VSVTFVQFTNSLTGAPAWVNPDYVRHVHPAPGHNRTRLEMGGGEGKEVIVEGDLKSVLEILRGERDGP